MKPKQLSDTSFFPLHRNRAKAALASLFVGDSLAMPVHWYYNPDDIERAFPGGIQKLEAAPELHPSSIMSLHSTRQGGRSGCGHQEDGETREVVGKVILKGRRHLWNQPNRHYHHGMQAGDNTLNAHCARVLMRSIITNNGCYNQDHFLKSYIDFMTADPPRHRDTYAESYHRGFFANFIAGKRLNQCGARTHDTPSMGGLVTIGPLAIHELLQGYDLEQVKAVCRKHLFLTHPDDSLGRICDGYVALISGLLMRKPEEQPQQYLLVAAQTTLGIDLEGLVARARSDREVVGGKYSTACYINDSWPSLLYLAYKYLDAPREALLANTNLGGENAHRGAVLGGIVSLASSRTVDEWFSQLLEHQAIESEINALITPP
ncbi:ADP-ribosyl-glycohydrolase superfamily protein [Syntrophotalea carbinolica DSM 2380]|uniref:ADP-ribosyl-glycohydrolase superfamily protein n=1 Tax=Syntrophotalea carbinolica (strain DSM 2380 / NBRC 103641 / GraBd1) TaxID=338963 RepID=Q3A4W4_SYNC1|nr:ADP-ribosylglycohydrolase family protein [Syntrophotalea carbinolica]ABA88593.1 ADP-ribosyl-glycohydrolase superfamily protein [Syntrophotalea carbinolica DSM 2380]